MYIRKADSDDARKISYLIYMNTENVSENNYSKAQIEIWKKQNTPKRIRASLAHRDIFCVFDNERLLGTIALQHNEVVGLYVAYSKRKKGIGKILLEYVENYAKQKNIHELFLTSTPSAENFYQRNGYNVVGSVELVIGGVLFRELKMIKNV